MFRIHEQASCSPYNEEPLSDSASVVKSCYSWVLNSCWSRAMK